MNEVEQHILDTLAQMGIIVSFVYGSSGNSGIRWSVDVLTPNGKSFEQPYAAENFEQCLFIVITECRKRGWIPK